MTVNGAEIVAILTAAAGLVTAVTGLVRSIRAEKIAQRARVGVQIANVRLTQHIWDGHGSAQ